MVVFLVKHKLINTSQHGFIKTRSCLTILLYFLEEITKWVDDGSKVNVVYLDFQKAFDKVPHQRLLLKLKAHGIDNDVINWIEECLTHIRQRVKVNGSISNWKYVLSGVPQVSVLGPLLFLRYINDLEDDISSKVLKFADETKLVKEQCRLVMRKYSFSQRVLNEWNKLPNGRVNASSVNMFKNRIDIYLIRAGYTYMRNILDSR